VLCAAPGGQAAQRSAAPTGHVRQRSGGPRDTRSIIRSPCRPSRACWPAISSRG